MTQLSKDCLFLDIGANVCACSERLLEKTQCSVWAFEAVPDYANFCHERLGHNSKFRVFPLALCEKPAVLDFYVDGENLGWNTLETSQANPETGKNIQVLCVPLDNIFPMEMVHMIAGAKIDTEGAEYMVLAGMRSLTAIKAFSLHVEVAWGPSTHPHWASEVEEFEFLFTSAGYERLNYNVTGTQDVVFMPQRVQQRGLTRSRWSARRISRHRERRMVSDLWAFKSS